MASVFHTLRIAAIRPVASDAIGVAFDVPDALAGEYAFRPGQYLTLRAAVDGQDVRRPYSICSVPGEGLAVGIRIVPGGVFSTWMAQHANPGDTLEVMTPQGRFALPPDAGPRLVLAIAAGSGITPILPMIATLLRDEPASRVVLLWGNRASGTIMFRADVEDLKDRYLSRLSVLHVLSREQQDVPGLNGRIDPDRLPGLLKGLAPVAQIDQVLVCGPMAMTDGVAPVLASLGIPASRIRQERFTPAPDAHPPVARPAADAPAFAVVTAIHDGTSATFDVAEGEALIDAALRAGRSLPFACKGGMCCTCRARVTEGKVEMAVNYSLEPWEIDQGFVLTCQSRPVTPRVTVDFDAV